MARSSESASQPRWADTAITGAVEDRLGRRAFAGRLADAIIGWPTETSIVVGLYGEWGSGKSSILNMALERMRTFEETDDAPETVIIEFNPWNYSEQSQMVRAFFNALSSALGRKDRARQAGAITKLLQVYSLALAPAQFGAGFVSPSAAKVLEWTRDVAKKAGGGLKELADLSAADASALKRQISKMLGDQHLRAVVVMDDIDRLSYAEIRQVFQLVKANADFHGVSYLMAFDDRLVRKALLDSFGEQFLEKIVQVAIPVPEPDSSVIVEFVQSELREIKERLALDYDETDFLNTFFRGPASWFRNLRDAARYLNAVAFSSPLVRGEVWFPDFLSLEALRLFQPRTHSAMREFQRYLLGTRLTTKEDDAWFQQFTQACGAEWSAVSDLMQHLLPIVEEKVGNYSINFSSEERMKWIEDRRLRSDRYWSRYFAMGAWPSELSEREFEETLELTRDVSAFRVRLNEYLTEGRLGMWLSRLVARMHVGQIGDPDRVALALFECGDIVPTGDLNADDLNTRLVAALYGVAARLDREALRLRMVDAGDLLTIMRWISRIERDDPSADKWLSDFVVADLKPDLLKLVRGMAADDSLLSDAHFTYVLSAWALLDDAAQIQGSIARWLHDGQSLAALLPAFVAYAHVSGGDDLRLRRERRPNSHLLRFVELDDLKYALDGLPRDLGTPLSGELEADRQFVLSLSHEDVVGAQS